MIVGLIYVETLLEQQKANNIKQQDETLQLREMLLSDISAAGLAILSATQHLIRNKESLPTAADIQKWLISSYPLKKTQLYDRLSFLVHHHFLIVDSFAHPRQYYVDHSIILSGATKWLKKQKGKFEHTLLTLEEKLSILDESDPMQIAGLLIDSL